MMGNGMMDSGNLMIGWGGMFFGPLLMIGLLALIVMAIVMLVRRGGGDHSNRRPSDGAMSILNERFAAGEIDEAEFEARKHKLQD